MTAEEYLNENLQDPAFRAAWEESEPAYELKRLRIMKKLSRAELARKVGTRQPSIARLESGYGFRNLAFLKKVAEALDAQVEIRITPKKMTAAPKTKTRAKQANGARTKKNYTHKKTDGSFLTCPFFNFKIPRATFSMPQCARERRVPS